MRMSSLKDDPGYEAWIALGDNRQNVRIKLNGQEMKDVSVADEDAGYIVRAKRNELHLVEVCDGEIVTETLHGAVEIVLPQVH